MNIVMPVTATVKPVQFAVATPQQLGADDARHGFPCRPDFHFGQGDDMYGWEAKYQHGDYVYAYITAKGL